MIRELSVGDVIVSPFGEPYNITHIWDGDTWRNRIYTTDKGRRFLLGELCALINLHGWGYRLKGEPVEQR